jgi:spore coat polysaccharide biosynthesis protein SpsF
VNADSPFVAAPLLRQAIELCEGQPNVDLISNVRRRYWPYGIACELISIDAAKQLVASFPIEKGGKPTGYHEHITSGFYAAPEKFNILDLVPDNNVPDMSGAPALTVDEPKDVERLEGLLADYDRSPVTFTYTDLVNRR